MKIRVLKLGWEFPPNSWGGLGVACHGLVSALVKQDTQIDLVLPCNLKSEISNCKIVSTNDNKFSLKNTHDNLYKNLLSKINHYTRACKKICLKKTFDVIHAHDWMTFQAGVAVKKITGKPLFLHVHSVEFDRSLYKCRNKKTCKIEEFGFYNADKIFTVSKVTKDKIIKYYKIPEHKIEIVHNGIAPDSEYVTEKDLDKKFAKKSRVYKVLFLGRLTFQKNPESFIKLANKILKKNSNIEFIIAGDGDLKTKLIKQVLKLKIKDKIKFVGYLKGKQIDQAYKDSDLYIMPSRNEPFGLTPLESMKNGTPVVITKVAGACEVIKNCLKVDFKDINSVSKKIINLLESRDELKKLSLDGLQEVKCLTWDEPARKCVKIYKEFLSGAQNANIQRRDFKRKL